MNRVTSRVVFPVFVPPPVHKRLCTSINTRMERKTAVYQRAARDRPLPNLSPPLSVTYTVTARTPCTHTRKQWRARPWVRVMPTAHGSLWRHKHRCDANYAKGRPRCFVAREPKLSTRFSLSLAFPSNGAEEDRPSVSNCTEISDNFTHCRLSSLAHRVARIINARLFRHLRHFRFERDKKKRAHTHSRCASFFNERVIDESLPRARFVEIFPSIIFRPSFLTVVYYWLRSFCGLMFSIE